MKTQSHSRDAQVSEALLDRLAGSWLAQAISVAAKLGIADLIKDDGRACSELAQATETKPDALYRVMRTLASVGIFAEGEPGRFHSTPLADGLRSDSPRSVRDYAIMLGEEWHSRVWGRLFDSMRSGTPAFEMAHGIPVFDYLARNPAAGAVFDAAMTSRGKLEDEAIASAYDFGRGTVVDLGGGRGSLIAMILKRHTQARGVLFDLPHVLEGGVPVLTERGVGGRCRIVRGDFFDEVPTGGDVYLMKKIIHDWDDEKALTVLSNCRAAMGVEGRLLLVELVILPGNDPSWGKLIDLQMLVQTPGGKERTESEYRGLLSRAGFELVNNRLTSCALNILEGRPV